MAEPKIRFKQNDGGTYPAWKEVRLGDVASRVTRKNANNETDRPLTIASIEGLVDQRTYFGKTVASKDMSGYFLLKNGYMYLAKSFMQEMEAIGYHVAAGHIERDLLTDVMRSIIRDEDYSESTKIEILHAMGQEIGFADE